MIGRLFWKILLTFWLTLLVAGGSAALAVWWHHRALQSVSEDVVIRPSSILSVQAAANTFRFGGKEAVYNMLLEQSQEAPAHLQVYAVDANHQELLGRSVPASTLERIRKSVDLKVSPPIARSVQAQDQELIFFAPLSGQFPEFQKPNRLPARYRDLTWPWYLSGLIVSFISSFLLAWHFSKPVRLLSKAFKSLAQGDLNTRISSEIGWRRDEIADLGHDFDHMAGQLQNLMTSQRRLLHDVSHELRSPLARLQVSIGLARQQPEHTQATLDRIEYEAERLDKLVGEVLTLSRLEAGVAPSTDEYVDVLELLDTVVDDARFEASALNRSVVLHSSDDASLIIPAHGELLYRALENVVRNALHHTPPETTVTVTAYQHKATNTLHITVDDQGSGVPPEEIDLIFEPFQRSSQTSNQYQGYGLGLAIARRAIDSHSGRIRASNRPEGGLRISIELPLQARQVSEPLEPK
ncbi:two-component system, OmpR family, sensor kinase [Thiothrix eikelboomii]|uniref:histidine kinase n=1 Tax=Thiothrix eikelboomii TaxID=92487 RepID=A0A1T4XMV5_9GAMM|nr:ATP-binding protein [Thiothrix eikelboomii]SKA90733.1 two-component system, OmpR family, sensor kinase [Thiothrix eikelboomii]